MLIDVIDVAVLPKKGEGDRLAQLEDDGEGDFSLTNTYVVGEGIVGGGVVGGGVIGGGVVGGSLADGEVVDADIGTHFQVSAAGSFA